MTTKSVNTNESSRVKYELNNKIFNEQKVNNNNKLRQFIYLKLPNAFFVVKRLQKF